MEIWKSIKGYEDYEVSSLGRVKSLARKGSPKEMILKGSKGFGAGSNYLLVAIYKNKKRLSISIHKLVAQAFLNHKPNGNTIVVDHIDNDENNNAVSNLQLISHRENLCKDKRNKTSKYTGVTLNINTTRWVARIREGFNTKHLGTFNTELEASNAYQLALKSIL